MKRLIACLIVLAGPALADNTGPLPQTGMEQPGKINGAKESGAMDTTSMSPTKGNVKRDKDGAPVNSGGQAKQPAMPPKR